MVLGIDVGGSKILAVQIEEDYIVRRWRINTRNGEVIDTLKRIIEESGDELIGIGLPGYLRDGVCVRCPNISELNGKSLQKIIGDVIIMNDCTAMAYGEYMLRDGKYDPLLLIALGTGVGSGLVYRGRPYMGRGSALEIGHLKGFSKIACECGKTGCLETVLGGKYVRIEEMAERARNGDLEAMHFFEEYGKNLALALSHAIHILDPEMVVIGGGIGKSYELFMPIVKENLQELLSFISVDDILFERAKSEESGALGAAYIAKGRLL